MDSPKPEPSTAILAGKQALLICADERELSRLSEHLSGWGIHVRSATTALEGLVALRASLESDARIDLVLYNPRGQAAPGEQFAVIARSEPALRRTLLVHLGQPLSSAHEVALRKSGFRAILGTPLDKTLLFEALHRVYGPRRGGDSVARLLDRYTALGPSTPPLEILVAEPSTEQRRIIRLALQRGGHHLYEVENGEQTLDALDGHAFDLVLIDLDLPGIGAPETARLYHFSRAQEDWPVFIALADQPRPAAIKDCRREEIAAIVEKPIRPQALLETIAAVIRRAQGLAEPSWPTRRLDSGASPSGLPLVDESILAELDNLGAQPGFLAGLVAELVGEVDTLLRRARDARGTPLAYPRFLELGHALKDSAGSLGTLRLYELGLVASHLPEQVFDREGEQLLTRIARTLDDTHLALVSHLDRHGLFLHPG